MNESYQGQINDLQNLALQRELADSMLLRVAEAFNARDDESFSYAKDIYEQTKLKIAELESRLRIGNINPTWEDFESEKTEKLNSRDGLHKEVGRIVMSNLFNIKQISD